jgi:hypothetical protein
MLVERLSSSGRGPPELSVSPRRPAAGSRGIDTFNLLLDPVMKADLSGYRWKDGNE